MPETGVQHDGGPTMEEIQLLIDEIIILAEQNYPQQLILCKWFFYISIE